MFSLVGYFGIPGCGKAFKLQPHYELKLDLIELSL